MSRSSSEGLRDLNGRPVALTRMQRLATRFGRRGPEAALDVHDGGLLVVLTCTDDTVASSIMLESSDFRASAQAVVRHLLILPIGRAADAVAVVGLDGYVAVDVETAHGLPAVPIAADHQLVVVARVQMLDAIHLSRERSRMASLGSRHGGSVLGWQVLQSAAVPDANPGGEHPGMA